MADQIKIDDADVCEMLSAVLHTLHEADPTLIFRASAIASALSNTFADFQLDLGVCIMVLTILLRHALSTAEDGYQQAMKAHTFSTTIQ